jgi:hypothetical protein
MPYAQKMGSKEKNTPGNFSEKDSKLISKTTQSKLSRGEINSFIQSQAPKKPEVIGSSGGLAAVGGLLGGAAKAAGRIFSAASKSPQYLKGKTMTKIKNPIPDKKAGNFREIANAKLRRGLNKGDKKDLTY